MTVNEAVLERTVALCKERHIIIPTFENMRNPSSVPEKIQKRLETVGLWDIDPVNLFRITWKNDIKTKRFGNVNYLEIPREITGIKARVIGLVGKYFPTGAHKVGAAFGCLVPKLVTGEFCPTTQKAVWPSTGNYCRGGAFDCALLACTAVAILPQEMSQERFTWLKSIGAEVIATPGCESNVKEIYDKCWEIKNTRKDCVIFNQFDEFGNPLWHYNVTGPAIEDVFEEIKTEKSKFSGYVSATGSAGTIAAGDYLKKKYPSMKIIASEALQCPTLLLNGYGAHRIEGIGDKHVPWVHNARNTDFCVAIDDEDAMQVFRLFNEEKGIELLQKLNPHISQEDLKLLGISSISNMLSAIKYAKYHELDENDIVFTIFTDSSGMYLSRLEEMKNQYGEFTHTDAHIALERRILGQNINHVKELSYYDRKAIHHLKYFTWVEQQQKDIQELNKLWHPETWDEIFEQGKEIDKLIIEFNQRTGL